MNDAQRMIEAYRACTVPDAATKVAMRQRLRRASTRDPRRFVLTVALSVGLAAAILLALAAMSRVIAPSSVEPAPDEAAVYGAVESDARSGRAPVHSETQGAVTPAPRTTPKPSEAPAIAPPTTAEPPRARARSTASQREPASTPRASDPPSTAAPRPSVSDEARLLVRAQQALRTGSPGRALALLDEHERRFPTGAMALEREALQAIASCEAGIAGAEERAAAVLAKPAAASYAARIRSACEH